MSHLEVTAASLTAGFCQSVPVYAETVGQLERLFASSKKKASSVSSLRFMQPSTDCIVPEPMATSVVMKSGRHGEFLTFRETHTQPPCFKRTARLQASTNAYWNTINNIENRKNWEVKNRGN